MARYKTRLTLVEIDRNQRRLDEVNQWIGQVDQKRWQIGEVKSLNGYILGVFMTSRTTGYCLLAGSLDELHVAEEEGHA